MKTTNTTSMVSKSYTSVLQMIKGLFILTAVAFSLGSCKSSDDEWIGIEEKIEKLLGLELQQATENNREEALQTFTIDAVTGGQVYGEKGTTLTFPSNVFNNENGDPVTGDVTIELIEIYDRANMVLNKMPTNGQRDNGDIETLISAGEFYINATKDGEQLTLAADFQLFSPNDEFDPEMKLFDGKDDDCDGIQCDVVWEENTNRGLEPGQGDGPDGTFVTGYHAQIGDFGWTNLDRWMSDPRPKTIVYADVPEGYDNTNCNVYISIDGEPTALALLDIYVEESGLFSEHYGRIPIGLDVHFIFVSVQNDEYVYAVQATTIGEDHIEVISTATVGSQADLVDAINNLP